MSGSVKRMSRLGVVSVTGVVLAAVLFVATNLFSRDALLGSRLDLTESRAFTLSEGTRTVLSQIDEPLVFRFFFSERLGRQIPQFAEFSRRIKDMLFEFANVSDGKLVLEVINPAPFSADEDRAVALGIQGVPLDQQGDLVYFGLAASNSTDDTQVIPFFQQDREAFLEYELARMVAYLANPKRIVVGLISDLPIEGDFRMAMMGRGQPTPPFQIMEQMRQVFDIRTLGGEVEHVPSDVDVLMVAYPKSLPEITKYAVDQYFVGGGHGMVLVDPTSEGEIAGSAATGQPPGDVSATLPELLEGWGITVSADKVVGDLATARRVNPGGAQGGRPVEYVSWMALGPQFMNPLDPVTANLEVLHLSSAGAVGLAEGSALDLEPLAFTSDDLAGFIETSRVGPAPDVEKILREFQPDGERKVLAARISGLLPSAYPDGPPAEAAEGRDLPDHVAQGTEPTNMIVVGDTDVLQDRAWVRVQNFFGQRLAVPSANNDAFVLNALENLAGDSALIRLRSRGSTNRPFELIQSMEADAANRLRGTEQTLRAKLEELEAKLAEARSVEQTGEGGITARTIVLDEEQQEAIKGFEAELLSVRQQLREVQRALREDIERLQTVLTFVNVGLVPILVIIAALGFGYARSARRRRAVRAAQETPA
ncbi:MAG: Gldg family protein [Alphaproteobacteria bacterium]|nr:Gldg family protein [Alphaproteobacteria bacterium]